jgi:protein SCO1/2
MSGGNGRRLWVVLALGVAVLAALALWQKPRSTSSPGADAGSAVPSTGASMNALPGGVASDAPAGGALAELGVFGDVPDFNLVSQTGDSVRLSDLADHVWIGDFIFTNCKSSCPMMTEQLHRLDAALAAGARVRMVSFSVDPENDTPRKLAEYASSYNARPQRWLFLTGDKTQIRKLSADGFHLAVSDVSPEEAAQGVEPVLHSTRLVLVDGRGRIRGYYDGLDAKAMEQLGRDVQRLLDS